MQSIARALVVLPPPPPESDAPVWGTYRPDWLASFAIAVSQYTPLGMGEARKLIRKFLIRRAGSPLDSRLWGQPVRVYLEGNRCEWKSFMTPFLTDYHERRQIKAFLQRPNAVFLDIGANFGFLTLYASKVARADATLLAYEPHPTTNRRLQFNVQGCRNPPVRAFQVALGREVGELYFGGNDLSLTSVSVEPTGIVAPARPLLMDLRENGVSHIDVLKIDVEGHEGEVLEPFLSDAPDSLIPRCVIIEDLARGAGWKFDCIEAFERRGLKLAQRAGNNSILVAADRG